MKGFQHQTAALAEAFSIANKMARHFRHEYFTPEHLLFGVASRQEFSNAVDTDSCPTLILDYLKKTMDIIPREMPYLDCGPSETFQKMMDHISDIAAQECIDVIDIPQVVSAILDLEDSFAKRLLIDVSNGNPGTLLSRIIANCQVQAQNELIQRVEAEEYIEELTHQHTPKQSEEGGEYSAFLTCLNDHLENRNPLIGREEELQRTLQVLCRKDKNNPLHVGEPGVGKTALAYGLAQLTEEGKVPASLLGYKVYELDMGSLVAGTQYRGEFEKRLKGVLNEVSGKGKAILYIDEIHMVVGAGKTESSNLDAANLLKPYLQGGDIRVMGATTYEEYNRSFVKNKAFSRRFEKIDIEEPTIDECKEMLFGLKERYEDYHGVTYSDEAIEYATESAAKYITGRFLPDKAIDLMDEAGSWLQMHPREHQVVDKPLISEVLAKVCHIDILSDTQEDTENLALLEENIKKEVYGQDKAVHGVAEAVLMANAGLNDDTKPMATMLFVGPTGVGKTEVAKVLAKQLALPLVRFDMSEYAEKHTVAKLIGSPAGYVGYEDGGLLTDAIRKTPHCVLLLDELEKAHEDIYNIMLQIMDYGTLTDNKGQKADFRHVIIIMTTNAGARYAHQPGIGFNSVATAGHTMMKGVRSTFKPEFLNRLSAINIFKEMDEQMASLILDKKLRDLDEKLAVKGVRVTLSTEAKDFLLKEGFSPEYGGREIERAVNTHLKPLLMKEILFGSLKTGGDADITVKDNRLHLYTRSA